MNKLKIFFKDWKNQKSYAAWMMRYSKPYIFRIILISVVSIVSLLLSVWMAVLSKNIIDKASEGGDLVRILIVYIGVMLTMTLLNIVSQVVSQNLNEKFAYRIRKQVYDHIMNSEWLAINKYHTGDVMTRMTSDVNSIAQGIVITIPGIIRLFVELIVTFVTLLYFDVRLAIFAIIIAPISALVSVIFGKALKKIHVKVQESESRYRSYMQESISNLLIIKAFTNEDYSSEHMNELQNERYKWVRKKNMMGIVSSTALGFTFQVGYIAAFTYGAISISKNLISYGTMSLFLTLVNRVQAPIIGLAREVPSVVSILASAGRVIELQNIAEEKKNDEKLDADRVGVMAKDISFAYTPDADNIFENAQLEIKPGEFVALIGESGIGKTTLIRIIMSFVSNYEGNISFYNSEGQRINGSKSAREFMSYVPQGNTLFSGTVRANILMGKHDATEEEIQRAIDIAAASEFIAKLPDGLDTVIGERGHGISEGQAQRIAIARAIIKDAPFLILDEATSSLDSETELHVLRGLQRLNPKPTCLIITHRTSILEYCDREFKIDDRRISDCV